MSVSIKDIAREADVSHSTVSRALSDSPLVSALTKERIRHLAREMGYSPHAQARSLVMGRTLTIGVVVTTITDPFIAEIVQAVETTALDQGYSVILATSSSKPERELAAVEMLQSKRVDGVIVTSSRVGSLYQEHLQRFGVPIVLINSRRQEGPYTFSVEVNHRHGGHLATRHLIELGHTRIAYITGPVDHSDDLGRLAGYRQALAEADIGFEPRLVVRGTGAQDGGRDALPVLAELITPASAVFCYNDMTAIGLLLAAGQAGLDVPGDLAVVGFDDIPLASYVSPPLTTIAQPTAQMGKRAMEMVLALMGSNNNGEPEVSSIVIEGRLVVRSSSGMTAAPMH